MDGTDIELGSDAQGDIMYYNGTNWTRLAAGTSGKVLQANGAAAPSWEDAGGGGAKFVINTYTKKLDAVLDYLPLGNGLAEYHIIDRLYVQMIAPFAGSVVKFIVRSEFNWGSTAIGVHKNMNTTAEETKTVNLTANTTHTLSFTANSISASDLVEISFNPTNNPGTDKYILFSVVYEE